jgi:hypothetical protein
VCLDADSEGDAEAAVEWWRKLAEELLPLQLPPEEQEEELQQQEQAQQQGGRAAMPNAADQDTALPEETRKPSRAVTGEA